MEIVKVPNKVLSRKCRPVRKITDKTLRLAADMMQLMVKHDGLGLAAPQVGVAIQLIVFRSPLMSMALINPRIIETEGNVEIEETCLSIGAGIYYRVKRPRDVRVRGNLLSGELVTIEAWGTDLAYCLSHELDHLEGILISDKGARIRKM